MPSPARSGPAYMTRKRIRNGAENTQAMSRPLPRRGAGRARRPDTRSAPRRETVAMFSVDISDARADTVGLALHGLRRVRGRLLQQRHLLDLGLQHVRDLVPGRVRRRGLGGLQRL